MKSATLLTCAGILAGAMLIWPVLRARGAAGRAADAITRMHARAAEAQEVVRLRSRRPAVSAGRRPQPNVFGQLSDALVEAGLQTSTLKEVSPGEDAAVVFEGAPGPYRRQTMRVSLDPLTLPQAGKFFVAWRSRQPEWSISTIQLTPAAKDTSGNANRGSDRPLRVVLTMEATYLDLPQGATPP